MAQLDVMTQFFIEQDKADWDVLIQHTSEPWEEYGDDNLVCEHCGDYYQIKDEEDGTIIYQESVANSRGKLQYNVGRVLACIVDGDSSESTSIDIVCIDSDGEDNVLLHMDNPYLIEQDLIDKLNQDLTSITII